MASDVASAAYKLNLCQFSHDVAYDTGLRSLFYPITHIFNLKIAVRRKISNNVRIAPPGADFVIITITEKFIADSKPR